MPGIQSKKRKRSRLYVSYVRVASSSTLVEVAHNPSVLDVVIDLLPPIDSALGSVAEANSSKDNSHKEIITEENQVINLSLQCSKAVDVPVDGSDLPLDPTPTDGNRDMSTKNENLSLNNTFLSCSWREIFNNFTEKCSLIFLRT